MGTACGKADFQLIVRSSPRVEYDAATAFTMCIDEIIDGSFNVGLRQCLSRQIALPGAVARQRPMLQGASTADAEMRADRHNAIGACNPDGEQAAAIQMPLPFLHFNGFAGQRIRHVNRAGNCVSNAVAVDAETRDCEALGHV